MYEILQKLKIHLKEVDTYKKLQQLKIYLQQVKRFKVEYPQNFNLLELVQFFPAWQHSLNSQASPLTDEQPWIPFAAIQFLERILQKDMRVFEYGAGGSTLFFAKRVKEIISVEHDQMWSSKIIDFMNESNYNNWEINFVKPTANDFLLTQDPSDPNAYISSLDLYKCQSFKDYATTIDNYPNEYFDLVLIDGRARPSCFKHAVTKLKKGGFLILDDAGRPHYSYVHKNLKSRYWVKHNLSGPKPYDLYFTQTCAWQKM